jgi:hypothetical protein
MRRCTREAGNAPAPNGRLRSAVAAAGQTRTGQPEPAGRPRDTNTAPTSRVPRETEAQSRRTRRIARAGRGQPEPWACNAGATPCLGAARALAGEATGD